MGAVYAAENVIIGKKVAVKVLHPTYAQNEEALQRFLLEAKTAATLEHPGIVEIFDYGTAETKDGLESPYLVMELLKGQSLSDLLKQQGPSLDLDCAVEFTLEILSVLLTVHNNGVIHRDLKPENIFQCVNRDGTKTLKILDFGISKVRTDKGGGLTASGVVLGTPYYMSLEQANGIKDIDHRVDLWSVGAMLYQMVTGCLPFPGESYNEVLVKIALRELKAPREIWPDLPEWIDRVILKAMAWDRDDRYRSAGEFAGELKALHEQAPVQDGVSSSVEEGPPDSDALAVDDESDEQSSSETPAVVGHAATEPALAPPIDSLGGVVRDSKLLEQKKSPWRIVAILGVPTVLVMGALGVWYLIASESSNFEGAENLVVAPEPSHVASSQAPVATGAGDVQTPGNIPPESASTEPNSGAVTPDTQTVEASELAHEAVTEPMGSQRLQQGDSAEHSSSSRHETSSIAKVQALDRDEVAGVLGKLTHKVRRCVADGGQPPSTVKVRVVISGNGSAEYQGADPNPPGKVSSCLRRLMASTRFRATGDEPLKVTYPYRTTPATGQTKTTTKAQGGERLLNNPFGND